MTYVKRFIGDPGCTLDDLAIKPEEERKAPLKFGDPGCTIDDLVLKPQDLEPPKRKPRETMDLNRPWHKKRLSERSGNVIYLEKVRSGA